MSIILFSIFLIIAGRQNRRRFAIRLQNMDNRIDRHVKKNFEYTTVGGITTSAQLELLAIWMGMNNESWGARAHFSCPRLWKYD